MRVVSLTITKNKVGCDSGPWVRDLSEEWVSEWAMSERCESEEWSGGVWAMWPCALKKKIIMRANGLIREPAGLGHLARGINSAG